MRIGTTVFRAQERIPKLFHCQINCHRNFTLLGFPQGFLFFCFDLCSKLLHCVLQSLLTVKATRQFDFPVAASSGERIFSAKKFMVAFKQGLDFFKLALNLVKNQGTHGMQFSFVCRTINANDRISRFFPKCLRSICVIDDFLRFCNQLCLFFTQISLFFSLQNLRYNPRGQFGKCLLQRKPVDSNRIAQLLCKWGKRSLIIAAGTGIPLICRPAFAQFLTYGTILRTCRLRRFAVSDRGRNELARTFHIVQHIQPTLNRCANTLLFTIGKHRAFQHSLLLQQTATLTIPLLALQLLLTTFFQLKSTQFRSTHFSNLPSAA